MIVSDGILSLNLRSASVGDRIFDLLQGGSRLIWLICNDIAFPGVLVCKLRHFLG